LQRKLTGSGDTPKSCQSTPASPVNLRCISTSLDDDVVDVGSLNSTYLNREPVDSAVLVNGDEVQIGKFRLTFLTKPKNHGGAGGTHDSDSTDR
jgi:pSer/pThr/pTyr-binding forkhead associated (FHA) protein